VSSAKRARKAAWSSSRCANCPSSVANRGQRPQVERAADVAERVALERADHEHPPVVPRPERAVERHARPVDALARVEPGGGLLLLHVEHAVEQRRRYELAPAGALARQQGQQDPLHEQHAGHEVAHRRGERLGRVALAGATEQRPGHGLRHPVLAALLHVRPGQPVPGAHGVDQAWVALAELFVAEAQALHGAGPEVVGQHVGACQQALDDLRRGGGP
jgi:hypothetical protein